MDLKLIVPPGGTDFSPEGATRFLANFAPRFSDVRKRIDAFEANPRAIIEHAFELTASQRAVLADTTDTELKESLQPVFEALKGGGTAVVSKIEMTRTVTPQEPTTFEQQQAQRQIVITIGRGRCKITITIDL